MGKGMAGKESFPGSQALLGLRPTDSAAPLPGHERSSGEQGWGDRDPYPPCAGCDWCSLCFSAVCLPMQASADFISYRPTPSYGEYIRRF